MTPQMISRAEKMLIIRDNILAHLNRPAAKPHSTKTEQWILEYRTAEAQPEPEPQPEVPAQLSQEQYNKLVRKMSRITDNQKVLDTKLQHLINKLAPEDKKDIQQVEPNSDVEIDITDDE